MRRGMVAPVSVLLFVACGGAPPPPPLRLVDVAGSAGLGRTTPTYAVAAADFDADGAVDLFVSNHRAPAVLYRNLGGGRFGEATDVATFAPGDLHGASWLDWNDDGWLDLFVAVGADRGTAVKANRLYLNRDGRRLDAIDPAEPVADPRGRGRSGCPLDLDGDGRLELLLLNGRPGTPNRLVARRNGAVEDIGGSVGVGRIDGVGAAMLHLVPDGPPVVVTNTLRVYRLGTAGRLVDVTGELGLPRLDSVQSVAVGDYDNDGDLDLFAVRGWMEPGGALADGALAFELPFRKGAYAATRVRAAGELTLEMEHVGPRSPPAARAELLHLGAARQAVAALPWRGRSDDPALAGGPDPDPGRDAGVYLWRDPDGTLVLSAVGLPRPGLVRGRLTASEGVEVVEAFATSKRPRDLRSRLFENRNGVFTDVTDRAGITTGTYGRDAVFADLDNDGDLDLFVVTGGQRGRNPPDVLYRNDGDGTFTDVSEASGAVGPTRGTGDEVVALDVDGDGRLDLLTTNGHGPPPFDRGPYWLGRNESEAGGFVEVSLEGMPGNPSALGTRVRADTGGRVLGVERYACTGPHGTSVLPLHLGLGTARTAELDVTWPSGRRSQRVVRAGERVRLAEAEANR
jgi:hypothetical protein